MRTNEELVRSIRAGERNAVDQLWVQCYGFIRMQAIRWAKAWNNQARCDTDDFTQSGYIALCEAVKGFSPEKGNFIVYLSLCLKTEFQRVAGCRTAAQRNEPLNNAISLDAPAKTDDEIESTVGDLIPVEEQGYSDIEHDMNHSAMAAAIDEALQSITPAQRKAIEAHFFDCRTYAYIGSMMQVSSSYIGEIVQKGMKSLRTGKHAPTLSEMLWGDRDFYRHTGFSSWRETGCSVQEWNCIWKEREIKRNMLNDTRESKIRYCVEVKGMDMEEAERYICS